MASWCVMRMWIKRQIDLVRETPQRSEHSQGGIRHLLRRVTIRRTRRMMKRGGCYGWPRSNAWLKW